MMDTSLYISALSLGLLGSFHCAGMCGPLALMLPTDDSSNASILKTRILYNAGRVFSYISIGLIFGFLGLAIALQGFQKELSVFTGAIILISIVLSSGKNNKLKSLNFTSFYSNAIRKTLKKLFSKKSPISLFFIGVLNGFLPCGFVYLAVAGAASTGSVKNGMMYMLLFGLGTFPMMMTISIAANYLGVKFSRLSRTISPIIGIALAFFLIYRGTDMKTNDCCEKKAIDSATNISINPS
jgi:uncharacterized protein